MRLSELVSIIFERPGLYIGYGSVVRMESFLSGYVCAMKETNPDFKDELYSGFSSWVCTKFGLQPTTRSWAAICAFHSLSEQGAFDLASELWQKYTLEMAEVV